jgi:hypothetical protein
MAAKHKRSTMHSELNPSVLRWIRNTSIVSAENFRMRKKLDKSAGSMANYRAPQAQ